MIVVDTNILVSFTLQEDVGVRLRRRDPEWTVPGIATSELRNVLTRFVRQCIMPLDEAKGWVEFVALALGDRVHAVDGEAVLDAALECGLTAYDAEFVVCARALGVPLVTLDSAILRGAPDVAVSPEAFAQR